MVEDGEIRVVHRGGSKICFRPPVVTRDSRFLLCAAGESVRVHSTSTEECVQQLRGHTDLVTGILLKPSNHLQAYSCSLDGTIRLWDFTDGVLIKTYVVGYPMHSLHGSSHHEGVLFAVTPLTSDLKCTRFQLVAVRLPISNDQQVEAKDVSSILSRVSPNPAAIAFGRGGEFLASVRELQLEVFFFKKQKSYRFSLSKFNMKGGSNAFTCVACHPIDDCIVTGHEDGKIRRWRNFNQQKEYTYSMQHWHHAAVSSLCFTPEGTNLLSGGAESVLVQWRYDQESEMDFLPRLGAAITAITVSPDGSLFCTSHADNKITIIQGCVKVSAVIQGLVKTESLRVELMVDPRTKALVLNGKPGHLQFYSLQRDKLLFNLDIVQQELIHEAGLQQIEVVAAALDASGSCLATAEEWPQRDGQVEVTLKLWAFDPASQSFVLNTTITAPHDAGILGMCFCCSDARNATLVTASRDGLFKAWRRTNADDSDEASSWSCDFVGSFHGQEPRRCCASADGSLLAVSFAQVVTLWSPASWELLVTLSQPPGAIRHLCFGRMTCSKYLVGTTERGMLCCWNLLTCSLEWSTSLDVSLLLYDPSSEHMAAFCSQDGFADVYVFQPSEPRPLFSQKAVCSGEVKHGIFVPRDTPLDTGGWTHRSQLYFLSPSLDLLTFSTKAEDEKMAASGKQLAVDDSVAMTPFQLLLGKQRREAVGDVETSERIQLPTGSVAIRELLQTPAHVLPATSFLCSVFVESLLISVSEPREDKQAREETDSEKEEDESEEEREAERPGAGPDGPGAGAEPSRAEMRQLKRVRKTDHKWVAGLLDP